jgi:hypothetical protein
MLSKVIMRCYGVKKKIEKTDLDGVYVWGSFQPQTHFFMAEHLAVSLGILYNIATGMLVLCFICNSLALFTRRFW